jgi:DHA1 family multidrug resistance protein-like MFS transporter
MIFMVYYRRNLWVLSFATFLANCGLYQVTPFLPLFIKELGVDVGISFWAGVTLAAQTVAQIVMFPYWGKLADKYGSKLMIIRAGVCGVLIYLGMSYCRTVWQLLWLRVINGALTGFIPASLTLVGINTPRDEAASSLAIVQSAIAFGAIIGPSLGSILANWVSYRGLMMTSGGMLAVGVVLVYLLVEERQKITTNTQSTSLWQDFQLALQIPVLVAALCSEMAYSFLMASSQPILSLYIQELTGIKANLFIGPVFALPGLALVLTNYCWCRLGERYTFQKIIVLGLIGMGLFILLQGMNRNIWWFVGAYFLVGLSTAAVCSNITGLIATKVAKDFQGRAFAFRQSFWCLGFFLSPLLSGFLGSVISLQWVFVVIGFLGLAMALIIQMLMVFYQRSKRQESVRL